MFSMFSEEAQKVLILAKNEMMKFRHPYVGSEHLLLAILKECEEISDIFLDFGVTYESFSDMLISTIGLGDSDSSLFLYTPLLKRILENACISSREMSSKEVNPFHLVFAMLEEGDGVAIRILDSMDVDLDDVYDIFSERLSKRKTKKPKKLLIEDFGVDLTKKALKGEVDPVIGRDEELHRVIEILSRRSKNNPLLVGEAGVGKTAIVEELARRIVKEQVPLFLKDKRIISVEIASLVAGTKYRGEFEERVSKILQEVESRDDIIVFIDEVHTLVGAGGAEGAIDASNILKPSLARGKLRLIGATTIDEYKKTIEKDKAFDRRFQKVEIVEPNDDKTYDILLGLKELYSSYHGVEIDNSLLKEIITLTNDYIYDRKQPDKAIDVLDEVCAVVQLRDEDNLEERFSLKEKLDKIREKKNACIMRHQFKEAGKLKEEERKLMSEENELSLKTLGRPKVRVVSRDDVKQVVFSRSKIPIYEMNQEMLDSLSKMEEELSSKIVGQDKAISSLCDFTKRLKFGFKKGKRPASFLFVGPTGVGKTYLVKEYVKMMGLKDSFIRLDMSEYMESHSISKIIGSPAGYVGYDDGKNILEQVRLHPYSVILLDEIEKASPNVLNLFLQVLDEGCLKDSTGKEVRFDHTTIIMTSNIGFGKGAIGFCEDGGTVLSKLKDFLSIEFINRLDEVIVFKRLEKEDIHRIVEKKLKEVKEHFKNRGIGLTVSKKVVDEIISLCEYEEFGARKVDKIIEEKVDKIVIDELIGGKVKVSIKSII